jgi:hypothetical protein
VGIVAAVIQIRATASLGLHSSASAQHCGIKSRHLVLGKSAVVDSGNGLVMNILRRGAAEDRDAVVAETWGRHDVVGADTIPLKREAAFPLGSSSDAATS